MLTTRKEEVLETLVLVRRKAKSKGDEYAVRMLTSYLDQVNSDVVFVTEAITKDIDLPDEIYNNALDTIETFLDYQKAGLI